MSGDDKWIVRAKRGQRSGNGKPQKAEPRPEPGPAPAANEAPTEGALIDTGDDLALQEAPSVAQVDPGAERRAFLADARERAKAKADNKRDRRRTILQLIIFVIIFAAAVRLVMGPDWLTKLKDFFSLLTGG